MTTAHLLLSANLGYTNGIIIIIIISGSFRHLTQLDVGRINGLFRKPHQWQLPGCIYTVEQMAETAEAGFFKAIDSNPNHSLYQILPAFRPSQYSLRICGLPFQLPIINTTLSFNRCLFQFE